MQEGTWIKSTNKTRASNQVALATLSKHGGPNFSEKILYKLKNQCFPKEQQMLSVSQNAPVAKATSHCQRYRINSECLKKILNHCSLFSKRWIEAFYYKLPRTSFKHYSYLYLHKSKHANSFYKCSQTDRRGSSLFIPPGYERIVLNLLKPNHIFILCHMLLLVILCPGTVSS